MSWRYTLSVKPEPPTGSRRGRALIAVGIAITVAALGAYGVAGDHGVVGQAPHWFHAVYVVVLLWAVRTTAMMNYFDPVVAYYWYFVSITLLGTNNAVQSSLGTEFALAPRTYLALAVHLVALMVGASLGIRRDATWNPADPPRFECVLGSPTIGAVGKVFAAAGGALTVGLIVSVWGFVPLLAEDAENVRVSAQSGLGFLVVPAMKSLQLGALVAFAAAVVKQRYVRVAWAAVAFSGLLLMSFGYRAVAMELFVEAFVIHSVIRVGRVRVLPAAALGIGLFVLLGLVGYIRYGNLLSEVSWTSVAGIALWRAGMTDMRNLQGIMDLFPRYVDFAWGRTLVVDFLALFPGPDENSGLLLKRLLGLEFRGAGITPTLVGELYLNFGWLGIVGGSFGFGFLLRRIAYAFCDRPRITVLQLVRNTVIVFMIAGMSTGLIGAIMFVHLIPFLVLVVLARGLADMLPRTEDLALPRTLRAARPVGGK